MEDEFKPNTDKAREEERVVRQISGTAQKKEKTRIQKFAEIFLPEDVQNVKEYIWKEVLIPSAKKAIVDTIETFIGYSPSSSSRISSGSPSYRAFYDDIRRGGSDRSYRPQATTSWAFDEYDFTYEDANEVIEELGDILDRYGKVRVADYYEIIKQPCPYTWNGYGWYDLRSVRPDRLLSGRYVIRMPRPVPITSDRR